MTSKTILRRQQDGKLFKVAMLGHWSDIQSDDGETDSVKWYGPGYVSVAKGSTYVEVKEPEAQR